MIDFILRPIRRRFGKDRKFYAAIDDMFGFIPHNIELYKLALIHKSASVTLDDGRQINNERLEFLGDAVIESVTSDYLFIEFPDQNEGFLTQLRSKMVSRQSLNEVAKRLKLDTHVITHSSASFSQKHIYGDAFEAMMGAIYLDQGYDFVNRLLINRIFGDYLRTGALLEEETDFKSRLIEWCQKNHHTIRFITSHDRSYSSSHPVFICKVLIDEEDCAKLFDRLDAIERGLTPSRSQRRQNDQNDQNDQNNDIPGTSEPQSRKAEKDTTAENRKAGGEKQERSEQNPDAENTDNTESESGAAKSTGRSRSSRRARRRAAAADNVTDTVTEEQTANADEGVTANIDANAPETISDQTAADSPSGTDAETVSTPDNVLSDTRRISRLRIRRRNIKRPKQQLKKASNRSFRPIPPRPRSRMAPGAAARAVRAERPRRRQRNRKSRSRIPPRKRQSLRPKVIMPIQRRSKPRRRQRHQRGVRADAPKLPQPKRRYSRCRQWR